MTAAAGHGHDCPRCGGRWPCANGGPRRACPVPGHPVCAGCLAADEARIDAAIHAQARRDVRGR